MGSTKYTLPESVSNSTFRLSSSYLMQTLRPQAPEVPHHVGVFHVGLRVTLLAVDEGRELQGVNVAKRLIFNVYCVTG